MKQSKTDSTVDIAPAPKRPGRRPKGEDGKQALSRGAVVECAIQIARRESIAEISIVRVGRELGVAAGLVHYYINNRNELLSAVLNAALKDRADALPRSSGDWRADLAAIAHSSIASMARWPGLGTYTLTHNRFRLFQQVQPGETDYGLVYFDRVGQLIRDAGFAQGKAALVYQLLMNLVLSIVVERENRLAPSHHADFIVGYVSQFDASAYPGADFLVGPFARLDTETTLECSLQSLLDTFASWRNS